MGKTERNKSQEIKMLKLVENNFGLLRWLSSKEAVCNRGDKGSIPGSGGRPGEGNGNPLQYSCLENPMDRGAWQVPVSPWGHKRTGQDLETKQQQRTLIQLY